MLTAKKLRHSSPSLWFNRTVIGIGLASLFSDWSHKIVTTVLPRFLATLGAAAIWLGLSGKFPRKSAPLVVPLAISLTNGPENTIFHNAPFDSEAFIKKRKGWEHLPLFVSH